MHTSPLKPLAALSLAIFLDFMPSSFGSEPLSAGLTLHADKPGATIRPEVYGHFAEHLGRCIYEGIWVGEDADIPNTRGIRNDVVAALKELDIPVLRWPGGCFADEYHWKDGIGPRSERPSMINTHWGKVVENNHFGTHEFFDLVEQLGTKAYVCGNVGSGTVQEMMEWVEYMTSPADSPMANLRRQNGRDEPWKLEYFGVGNESWGCGGSMRPEYYADLYRRYNTFVKNYTPDRIYRIACGANGGNTEWTDVMMDRAARNMDGLSVHYYTLATGNWRDKGPATGFDEGLYHDTLVNALRMNDILTDHERVMDNYDPDQRVGMIVDEWGIWTNVEPGTNPGFLYQQNTMRDAVVAALHFHLFHEHAARIHMANIAQTINVLQAMILTDGPRMLRTPTYWVFEMFKVHQGGAVLPVEVSTPNYVLNDAEVPAVSASASKAGDSTIALSLVNTHATEATTVTCSLNRLDAKTIKARVLTADAIDAHNTFDAPDAVMPTDFSDFQLDGDQLVLTLPPLSVVILAIE